MSPDELDLTPGKRFHLTFEVVVDKEGDLRVNNADGERAWTIAGYQADLATNIEPLDSEPMYEPALSYVGPSLVPFLRTRDGRWAAVTSDGERVVYEHDVPTRFPDGTLHRVADGGRP